MSKVTHLEGFSVVNSGIRAHITFDSFNKKLDKAQWFLDSQIMTDMVPLMPMQTGTFINLTRMQSAALAGTGTVIAAAPPMGRFLYFGKVMVDPETGSPWARPGAKKVLTDRPLIYSRDTAVPEWFEEAKRFHMQDWVDIVKKMLEG